MRNILIITILVVFVLFVIVVVILEKVKEQYTKGTVDKKNRQFIDVSDLANSGQFIPKIVGGRDTPPGQDAFGLGVISREEEEFQPVPKVTGAVFGQGFEVNKVDKHFRSGNGAIFTGVRCS